MNEKIMVVDDNPQMRHLVRDILRRAGYEVAEAEDGPAALALVKQQLPNLVFMDVKMAGMDGLEACRRLKSNPRTRSVPVVMLTASRGSEDVIAAHEAGADDYVIKPFTPKTILEKVDQRLAKDGPIPAAEAPPVTAPAVAPANPAPAPVPLAGGGPVADKSGRPSLREQKARKQQTRGDVL